MSEHELEHRLLALGERGQNQRQPGPRDDAQASCPEAATLEKNPHTPSFEPGEVIAIPFASRSFADWTVVRALRTRVCLLPLLEAPGEIEAPHQEILGVRCWPVLDVKVELHRNSLSRARRMGSIDPRSLRAGGIHARAQHDDPDLSEIMEAVLEDAATLEALFGLPQPRACPRDFRHGLVAAASFAVLILPLWFISAQNPRLDEYRFRDGAVFGVRLENDHGACLARGIPDAHPCPPGSYAVETISGQAGYLSVAVVEGPRLRWLATNEPIPASSRRWISTLELQIPKGGAQLWALYQQVPGNPKALASQVLREELDMQGNLYAYHFAFIDAPSPD